MESTDLSALRQTTSILCLRLSELLLDTDLHANHTKMGDIIFTLTSVSRALCAFDRPPGSTLDSIIQISSRFEQAIVELGTTSERMVTSSTRSATRLIQLVDRVGAAATLYGLRLYAQNLKKNFIRSCETELRDIISYITDNSNNTPRSSMEFVHNHTNRQPLRTLLDRELPNGRVRRLSETTEEDTDEEV